MLKMLDTLQLFPRENGTLPFLIVDGHGSHFELPFLGYICNPEGK